MEAAGAGEFVRVGPDLELPELQRWKRNAQSQKSSYSQKENQCHSDPGFAIDLGDEVACADV